MTIGGDRPGSLTVEQAKRLVELMEIAITAIEKAEALKEKDDD